MATIPSPLLWSKVLAQAVNTQFTARPTLRSVVSQRLHESIQEKFPALPVDTATLRVAEPSRPGAWNLKPLIDVALDFLATGVPADFSDKHASEYYLCNSGTPQKRITVNNVPIDIHVIGALINELPVVLFIELQSALADFWQQNGSTGISRWQWMGDLLRTSLRNSVQRSSDLTDEHLQLLNNVLDYPDNRERGTLNLSGETIHAYTLETTLIQGDLRVSVQASELLLVQGTCVVSCGVSGNIRTYPTVDAFGGAWSNAIKSRYQAEQIVWKRFEPDGNIFDTQAALILNQQLENLTALQLPAKVGIEALEALYDRVMDPAPLLLNVPIGASLPLTQLQAALPDWLAQGTPAERSAYSRHLVELANIKKRTHGRSFLEGIDGLRSFAAKTLQALMVADHPAGPTYNVDALELTYAVPVGDIGSSYIEHVRMTLTDLALKNLSGKPNGRLTLRSLDGQALATWLTPEYVEGLVTRADIGAVYPALLERLFFNDEKESRERENLFAQQLRVHLPMTALELAVRQQSGMTWEGYRRVAAVVKSTAADRRVDDKDIVIHTLGFLRKPGAAPDHVTDMFLIEEQGCTTGPVILYRPQYLPVLMQFSTREALMQAIALPGALQASALTWLSDGARAVYDNGGFQQPHYVRIGIGMEFDTPEIPEPVTLAKCGTQSEVLQSLSRGNLMQYLFGSYARTLVEVADRQSVSNRESRWASLLEGAGLLFNTLLLPLLRGPAMLVGWMLQIASGLAQDIPALESSDPQARELAWVDLLLNLGLVLVHAGASVTSRPLSETRQRPVALAPLRRTSQTQQATPPRVRQGSVGLPSQPPGSGHTLIDFNLSTAREASRARLFEQLLKIRVNWPENPPPPTATGPFKGLYRIGATWHASVRGRLFQVSVVPGFGEAYVVHPEHSDRPGIKLRTDGQGHWTLDEGLRLIGGGRKNRVAEARKANAERVAALNSRKAELQQTLVQCVTDETVALATLNTARTQYTTQNGKLTRTWAIWNAATTEQKSRIAPTYQLELNRTQEQRSFYSISLINYREKSAKATQAYRDVISVINDIKAVDHQTNNDREHTTHFFALWDQQDTLRTQLAHFGLGSGVFSRGMSATQRFTIAYDKLEQGEPEDYKALMEDLKTSRAYHDQIVAVSIIQEQLLDEMARASAFGKSFRDDLVARLSQPEKYLPDNTRLMGIDIVQELSLDRSVPLAQNSIEALFFHLFEQIRLRPTISAHIEMTTSRGYSTTERIDVLGSVVDRYTAAEHIGQNLKRLNPTCIRTQYLDDFLDNITQGRASAENDLKTLIIDSEEDKVIYQPPKAIRQKPATKRVFKTRSRGTLVGDLREAAPGDTAQLIEIVDPSNGEVIERFHEHAEEGVYVEIEEGPTQTPPPRLARSARAITSAAQDVAAKRESIESTIQRELNQMDRDEILRDEKVPKDWEFMLTTEADKLEALATELEHTAPSNQTTLTANQWRTLAVQMKAAGKQYRITGYKKQAPTVAIVDYLWHEKAVNIGLVKEREPTNAKDFLSEYAIRDSDTGYVLWYAHFHYTSLTVAKTAYTSGHLKRADQRNIGFKAQLAQYRNNSAKVIAVWRSKIPSAMAHRLFFYRD
ncbi:dermonecrotic toxin domain-containing protein [Pseudomonas sp. TE24901]